ncbi:MAG: hypothetical protein HOF45_09600 [Candidatus Marinimicrobia bacterium]|nr:hypothetical protein [Candidatus Neomarinimicrobiota bacterium]MBT3937875.1 hypothetical protein [Candidatus Neomarinimicrobiota bacterium]MBT3962386.1 hypothetical protein [Candidatus Neomarinimicrobiota bacterium]
MRFIIVFIFSILFGQQYSDSDLYNYYNRYFGKIIIHLNDFSEVELSGLFIDRFGQEGIFYIYDKYNNMEYNNMEQSIRSIEVEINGIRMNQLKSISWNPDFPKSYFFQIEFGREFDLGDFNYMKMKEMDPMMDIVSISRRINFRLKVIHGFLINSYPSKNKLVIGKFKNSFPNINSLIINRNGIAIGVVIKKIGYNSGQIIPIETLLKIHNQALVYAL